MAWYLVTVNGEHDKLFEDYTGASALLGTPGTTAMYCAPDPQKSRWNSGWPDRQMECYMRYLGTPYRVEFIPEAGNGIFRLLDDLPSDTRKFIPALRASGWLPMNWFMDVDPEDDAMAMWQDEPPYDDPFDNEPEW